MEKVKTFLNSKESNIFGVALGGALIGVNIVEFSVIGIVAGVFLVASEGLQYVERKDNEFKL